MILYEVNLSVDSAVAAEYLKWLHEHVTQIVALDGFTGVRIFEELEHDEPDRLRLVAQYYLADMSDLQNYFKNHAERMRADGVERFGGKFTASRRVMRLREEVGR